MVFAERFARLAAQKLGAGVAETVDTLLHIADNQVLAPSREGLLHQRAQIVPVHLRGVLEFVDEQMIELRAHLFVDKRHLPLFQHAAQQGVGVAEEKHVMLTAEGVDIVARAGK